MPPRRRMMAGKVSPTAMPTERRYLPIRAWGTAGGLVIRGILGGGAPTPVAERTGFLQRLCCTIDESNESHLAPARRMQGARPHDVLPADRRGSRAGQGRLRVLPGQGAVPGVRPRHP